YVYAWDLADEGLETVLGRIRPTGINTLTLAASYHAGKFLRPHGVGGKVYFPADGTVYFQARPERYGHIRPLVSPMVAEFDAFARLEQQAPDLERVAWVVCCHNTPLGQQHPEFTSRNAFGDPYPYSLCPAHPAVRDYVVNLVADLVDRHDLAGVALETPGWLPYDHGFHHEFALVPLDRFAKSLLALCFADATCSAARAVGIDADRLQARTRELLERYLSADLALSEALATEWWLAEVVSDPEFAAFLHWRCRVVADLVADVRAAVPAPTRLAVIPTVQRPPAAAWLEGSDLALLAGVADALEVPLYQPSAEEAWLSAWDARRRAGDAAALHFILRPSFPDLANGAETVAAVRRLEPLRPAGIAFYNYGHLRLASLDHVTAALAALG
ncbi:MAG: hypothetical protein K0S96_2018, partial [Geminicoccaceae bacterium]|nr:hypothetical protein [Geminicoccaceae bacterium]